GRMHRASLAGTSAVLPGLAFESAGGPQPPAGGPRLLDRCPDLIHVANIGWIGERDGIAASRHLHIRHPAIGGVHVGKGTSVLVESLYVELHRCDGARWQHLEERIPRRMPVLPLIEFRRVDEE